MKRLAVHISNVNYFLVLCCIVFVSFAYSFKTYHPFDPIKEVFLHLFVLLAFYLLIVRTILTGVLPFRKNLLGILVLLYLGYNTVSFIVSPYADGAYFINLVLLILLFFVVVESVNSEKKYTYLLDIISIVALASSIYGILQVLGYDHVLLLGVFGPRGLGRRMFAFFGNPNLFAAFIVIALPMVLSGVFTTQRYARWFFATCVVLLIVCLVLTNSRSGLLGGVVSLALFFVVTQGKAQKRTLFLGNHRRCSAYFGGISLECDGQGNRYSKT